MKNIPHAISSQVRIFLSTCFLLFLVPTLIKAQTITGPTLVCQGNSYTYVANGITPPTSNVKWEAVDSSAILVSANGDTCEVQFNNTGTDSVIFIAIYATISDTFYLPVTVKQAPTPVISSSDQVTCAITVILNKVSPIGREGGYTTCQGVCDSTVVTYAVDSPPAGSHFFWSVSGGAISVTPITADSNEVNVYWGAASGTISYSLNVTETDSSGCTGTSSQCFVILQKPQAIITLANGTDIGHDTVYTCLHSSVSFFSDSSTGGGIAEWIFGDNNTVSVAQNPVYQFNIPGTYTVTLVESNCACSDTARIIVVVSSQIGFTITCPSTLCANDTATYHVNDTCGATSYSWGGSGYTSILQQSKDSITVIWSNGNNGPGSITYTANCPGFCPYPTVVSVPIVPTHAKITGPNPVCAYTLPGTYLYSVPEVPSTIYYWSVSTTPPSGVVTFVSSTPLLPYDTAQHGNVIELTIADTGTINLHVNYYNPFLKCGGSADTVIHVLPQLNFSYTAQICAGDSDFFSTTGTPVQWCLMADTSTSGPVCSSGTSASITYTFNNPGIYTVIAIDPTGQFCDSAVQQVTVLPNPMPDSVSGIAPICPGGTYTYTATQANGSYTAWTISGGTPTTASGGSVSITWNNIGPYIIGVQSITTSSPYCSSPIVYDTVPVKPIPPVSITGPDTVCADADSVLFSATGGGDSYHWSVVTSSLGSVIVQTDSTAKIIFYHDTGTAIIQLIYRICSDSIIVYDTVHVVAAPALTITASTPRCEDHPITFTASPAGGPSSTYNWNFGNGNTALYTGNNMASETFSKDTTYTITVSATGINGCKGQSTASITINISPTPSAVLTDTGNTRLCPPDSTFHVTLFVSIENALAGTYTYSWYLNGSLIAGSTNPLQVTLPGSYTVVVVDTNGCADTSQAIVLSYGCAPCPAPDSAAIILSRICNTITVSPGLPVGSHFSMWTFGDESSSTIPNTTHTYVNSGYYQVTLYAWEIDSLGDTCNYNVTTTVHIPLVVQFFVNFSCNGGSSLQTILVDNSQTTNAGIASRTWYINGTNVGSASPYITTLSPGTYGVTLTVIDSLGDTCSASDSIVVPAQPKAYFTFSPNPACENTPVTFIPTWTNKLQIVSFLWTFGSDNSQSANDTAVKQFPFPTPPALPYWPVTLTIQDIYGCVDSVTEDVTIEPNVLGGTLSFFSASACLGDTVQIAYIPDSASTLPINYIWALNSTDTVANGYINPCYATQSGTYMVTVTDQYGCTASAGPAAVQLQNIPAPLISGSFSYCTGQTYPEFSAFIPVGLEYTWFYETNLGSAGNFTGFGTGGPVTSSPSLTSYTGITIVSVSLKLTDTATGCSVTVGPDTAYVHPVPRIDSTGPSEICSDGMPQQVTTVLYPFPDSVVYIWSSGQTGASISVVQPGIYTVTVTSIYGCSASKSLVIYPLPDFSQLITGCYQPCDSAQLFGPANYTNYVWFRNDTAFSTDSIVTVFLSGTYQLAMSNAEGCRDTSNPIYLDIVDCDTTPCCCYDYPTIIEDSIICDGKDSAGDALYKLTAIIWYPGPLTDLTLNADITGNFITTSAVDIGNASPYNTNAYQFTGIYTAPVGHQSVVILKWMIKDSCHVLATHMLPPPCDTFPCCTYINYINDTIYCEGYDSLGNAEYQFTITIAYPGPDTGLQLGSSQGFVTNVMLINSYIDPTLGQVYVYSGIYHTASCCPTTMFLKWIINDSCQTNPIGQQLPPPCDSSMCSIYGATVICPECVIYPGGLNVVSHEWEIQYYYTGPNGSALTVTAAHTIIDYVINHVAQTGENTIEVYGINFTGVGNDTLTLTIVDAITHDTCRELLPVSLNCDSPAVTVDSLQIYNAPSCPPGYYDLSVVKTFCSAEQPGRPESSYQIVIDFDNLSTDSFLSVASSCIPCVSMTSNYSGTHEFFPGVNYDTVTVVVDSGVYNICIGYISGTGCKLCTVTVCDSLVPCDSGFCSISNTSIPCSQCVFLDQDSNSGGPQMIHEWELQYFYTGANGSSMEISSQPYPLMAVLNSAIYYGTNSVNVYTESPVNPFSYDTLTMTIIDAATGDSCTHVFIASMACDSPVLTVFSNQDSFANATYCMPQQIHMSILSTSCYPNPPGFNYPIYSLVISIDNLTGDTLLGGSLGCTPCVASSNNNNGPSFFAPGVSIDTLLVALDTSVRAFCVTYGAINSCQACAFSACDTLASVCQFCSVDSVWNGCPAGDEYCIYDTTNQYTYLVIDVSFYYNSDAIGTISKVFDGIPATIIQPQIVTPGVNQLEAIIAVPPSSGLPNSLFQIINKSGDTCYLNTNSPICADSSGSQYYYMQCGFTDTIDSITCIPLISGESSYSFMLNINNPTSDTVAILVYTQNNISGTVTFNTNVLYPGNNTLYGTFSVADTSASSVSFSAFFILPCSYCSQTFVIPTPTPCRYGEGPVRMELIPNPTKDKTSIYYSFAGIYDADIIVSDAYGNQVTEFNHLNPSGELELITTDLEPGVYNVAAIWQKNLLAVKKLVILK